MWSVCNLTLGIIVLHVLSGAHLAAQESTLNGSWRGTVTVGSQRSSLQISFAADGTVLCDDGEIKRGKFTLKGDTIDILLPDDDPKRLLHIRISSREDGIVRGKISLDGEPKELSSEIEMIRVASDSSVQTPRIADPESCAITDLPARLTPVLLRYGVKCPIHVTPGISHPEGIYLSHLFAEILKAILGVAPAVDYAGKGVFTIEKGSFSLSEVEQIIKPLLAEPDSVTLKLLEPRCPAYRCALSLEGYTDLKTQYRNGDSVNFFEVWKTVLQLAQKSDLNLIPPAKVPPFSASTGLTPKTIGPDGIIYERVTVSIADPNADDKSEKGKYVQIHVKSEIWRKPAFAVKRAVKIEDECSAETGMPFNLTCTDKLLIEHIMTQIATPGRIGF